MNFLSRTNGFKFRKTADMTPRQRYINLDGSLYGSRHLVRFLTMPSVKVGAIITIFLAAGKALLQSESKRRGMFVEDVAIGLPFVAVPTYISWGSFKKWLPVSKSAVIDKLGYLPSNPTATISIERHYKTHGIKDASIAVAIYATNVLAFHEPFNPYPLCLLANAAWYGYAAYKLHRGDWTIQTSPPKPETKKAAVTAGKLATQQAQGFVSFVKPMSRIFNLSKVGSRPKPSAQPL